MTSILSVSMCFSIGFASWVSIGGDNVFVIGNIFADNVKHDPKTVFTYLTVTGGSFSKYGFLQDDGSYSVYNGVLNAETSFKANTARNNLVNSLANSNACKLVVYLYGIDSSGNKTNITQQISIYKSTYNESTEKYEDTECFNLECANKPADTFVTDNGAYGIVASSDYKSYSKAFPLTYVAESENVMMKVSLKMKYIGSGSFESFYNTYSATNAGFIFNFVIEEA